jgi:hypothetical protein
MECRDAVECGGGSGVHDRGNAWHRLSNADPLATPYLVRLSVSTAAGQVI